MLACQCTPPIITGAIDAVHPSFDMQARASSAARPGHLRAAALAALPPAAAARVAWTDARFPTIRDPAVLRGLVHSLGLSRTRLLSDDSAPTLLERSSGNWEDVMAGLGAGSGGDVPSMAAAFRAHVAPSAAAPSTRSKDWAGWRAVLSWATARRSLGKILPMSRTTLEALIWEMLACQCTSPIINGVIDAVQARHRCFALASPIAGPRAYSRLRQSLARFQGTQSPFKSPITPALVMAMLRLQTSTPAQERNVLAACVATVEGLRPSEGADLQACDLRFEFDLRHGPLYRGTAATNVMKRKNDQGRKGHHPRIGRGRTPATDIVRRLRVFMASIGTAPAAGCTKAARPHARCPVCAPLFPIFLPGGAPRRAAPAPTSFSDMILKALKLAGADTRDFSGVCARRGCISTAIEAGVPEPIIWLQTGHAQSVSARTYIKLSKPDLLFATWAAFDL